KNKEWDIPKLKELLEEVIPEKETFDDFEITHDFQDIGHKVMLLNAREIYRKDMGTKVLLLAFDDITEQKRLEDLLADSEERYRRLFETANDGIVLLEKDQGKITHANPAFEKMLGYNLKEVIDNKLQKFVVLPDLHDFQTIMQVLNKEGIIKFDEVPVITNSRQHLDTEIYFVDRAKLVQCNIRDVTGRKRQEEALRKSEEKFRTIFNSSSDAIFIHDSSGRFLEVNDVACESLGYTRDELLEMTLMDIDTPEAAKIVPEHIRHLHQEGFISFEGAHQRKDGQQFPVEITSRLIGYEGETWILSTVRDITERKQAEKELQRYQYLLDKSQEIAHLGSWEVDVPSGRLAWSDETYRIFGLEPQETEITYERFLQFIHPDDRDGVDYTYMESIRMNKDTYEIEHRILRDRDGSVRTVFEKCYHIRDDSGNIVRSVGMVQDITEQKQKEREIQEREEELQVIFNTVESGIILVDKDGCILQTNKTMTEMLRYDYEEIIGSKYMNYVEESETDAANTKMRQLMNHELDSVHLERRYQRSDGTTFWGSLSGRRLYYPDGTFWGVVGAIIDINERKQTEEALRQSESYYRTIFETSGSAMLIVEEDTTISLASSNFEELSGYSKHEIEGKKSWTEFVHPDDMEWMKEYHYLRRRDSHAAPRNYEFRFLDHNGAVRYGYLTVGMIPDTAQSVFSLVDITARKQAEERLRTAHDKMDTLVQLNADGLMVLDQDGIILFLNPAAVEMLGREQHELLGEQFGHPFIAGSDTEIELLSTSGEARVVELRGRKTEWNGQRALLASFRDITERKQAEERIYYLAYYDELTALPNRRLFHERLKQVTSRCEHFGEGGVVFLVDITRLREVNDTLGQQAGDELIRQVARRLADTVGEKDTVARVSGGEFLVLAEGKDASERAQNLGVRILEQIGRELELSGRLVYPGVNIGFTLFPQRGTDPDTLIKQGDIALSEAKKSAHRIQEFAGQEDWISCQFHLEHDLKHALANEEFFLCYQTQIDLRTGRIVGLEALLRWKHPHRGIVSPGEFIPVLEQTGLIASVDEWVIHRVCQQLKIWQEKGIFVKTSVNLSAQELTDDATIEVVRVALAENGVRTENLEVEITETGLMENVDRASQILQTISSWGVRVALDDFGTGYSSLSYLQKLPINTIKIDKEFVDGLP
ncbi:MAG: PAS domain S-box protein, partial [Desulfovermiculus sp.]